MRTTTNLRSSFLAAARVLLPALVLMFAQGARASAQDEALVREPGLSARFYYVGEPMDRVLPLVRGQTPNVSRVVPVLNLVDDASLGFEDTYLVHVEGFLETNTAGKYALRLTSDDGSILKLDGKVVIDHDGLHGPDARTVDLDLTAGSHALDLWYFECYGGAVLRLEWRKPGASAFELVPTSALSCRAGEVRVTAPGPKKVVHPLAKGRPGDGQPIESTNPALSVATIRPDGFQPKVGGIAWLPDGRMAITTWDEIGCVWFVDGATTGDPKKVRLHRFAAGLAEPLGIAVVDGRVFVLQKQELTELVDRDQDGTCDEFRCVSSAWNVTANFHEFAFGLVEKDGWLYFNLAIAIDPGGRSTRPQVPDRGNVMRVKISDGTTETLAHGLRTPNGIGLGPDGEIFLTDNQGDWLPCSKLLHLEKGAFYGSRAVLLDAAKDLAVTPPVLWMPQNEIGNSPGNPTTIPASFGPYAGQLCHGDVTHGGLKRDVIEKVDGVWQGCILDWTQGLEAGVNRVAAGPDGALYVGGIGSTGNWGQEGKLRYGLQRVAYVGPPPFEILAVRARSDGFEFEFTRPIGEGLGWEPENWSVESWRYVPTSEYGGPKVDTRTHRVTRVSIDGDRKKVALRIDALEPGRVYGLRVVGPVTDESGASLWSTQAWYTLNRIPRDAPGFVTPPSAPRAQNVLTAAEREAGWMLLFDGASTSGWRGYRQKDVPAGWAARDGALVRVPGANAGDLVTLDSYDDFELSLEWKITPGGNSGVFFHVDESKNYPWETGPEMQILDNERHPDGQDPRTSAGANYALHAPARDLTRPVGMWNQVRIVVKGAHVEHWLNGSKAVEYELWTDAWKALVADSKFASMTGYGLSRKGHVCLQDHGDEVAFRNVKLRVLH